MDLTDHELLRRYSAEDSEEAFAELTRRHLDLAWSAAARITGDRDLARDVAQKVFCDLARKARFMPERVVVVGWIYRAACLEARQTIRALARRAARERVAMKLSPPTQEEPADAELVEPLLKKMDEALCSLGGKDRDALLLRFFEKKSLAQVGSALGVSEAAAQKRVSRALEKLRGRLTRGAVAASAAAVGQALGVAGAQAAPAGLAGSIASTSAVSAGGGFSALFFHLKTQLVFMKTKLIAGATVLVAAAAPLPLQQQTLASLESENARLTDRAARAAALEEENRELASRGSQKFDPRGRAADREEIRRLRAEAAALDSKENERKAELRARRDALERRTGRVKEEAELLANGGSVMVKTANEMKRLGLATRLFAVENERRVPADLADIEAQLRDQVEALDRYEFYPGAEGVEITRVTSGMILFREKQPRRIKEGWQRIYAMFDGSVHVAVSETRDFAAWENRLFEKHEENLLREAAK